LRQLRAVLSNESQAGRPPRGKDKLGSITKQGDRYLRSLFTTGALAVIRYAKLHGTKPRPWLTAVLARRPTEVAAIALANKIARMAWAMMAKGERDKEPVALRREIAPSFRRDVMVGRANSTHSTMP
jgi:hypothetical protein